MSLKFSPGKNIAIKVPNHEFEQTVAFYADILGLTRLSLQDVDAVDSVAFEFGDKNLWIDAVDNLSQAEVWLEIATNSIEEAANYLEQKGVSRRDKIEPLPSGLKGFWISSPTNIIHLIHEEPVSR
ncbi:MAG TPA: hypothetical protein DCZ03_08215 [Gammaproteobacteria bacterium]|nr:hypothetical protein [Gammaproteobacteria bacterium]